MKKINKPDIVAKLTFAALALPGLLQTASAGRVEETYNSEFQYGHYSESNGRMQVNIYDGAISAPIGKSMTASVSLVRDIIAGASPVYNTRDAQGNISQVLSGASPTSYCEKSICEQRDGISGNLTKFLDMGSLSFGGGYSREHDYASKYFNSGASLDLNKKLTTLNFAASVAFDDIQPSPSGYTGLKYIDPDFKAHKTSQQYLLGVSQIINKDSLMQSNMTFGYHSGYLTDPYKQVNVFGKYDSNGTLFDIYPNSGIIQEVRPGDRFEWAWLNQYIRNFDQFNHAALHTDYRFSTNTWGINAHTFETSWYQPIKDGWMVIPRFRYYSQDQADFYQPVFDGVVNISNPNVLSTLEGVSAYSSDYRLAGFGTLSGGIKFSKEFTEIKHVTELKFQTGIEYYAHNSSFQLGGNNNSSFANFDYYLLTAAVNMKF
jgi:hypothetical protein